MPVRPPSSAAQRFSFKNVLWRSKLDYMVDFPLCDLDLRHAIHPAGGLTLTTHSRFCDGVAPAGTYELFGVTNHHGLIQMGHYIAHAKHLGCNTGTPAPVLTARRRRPVAQVRRRASHAVA